MSVKCGLYHLCTCIDIAFVDYSIVGKPLVTAGLIYKV